MIDPKTEISETDYMAIERLEEKPLKTLEERVQRLEDIRELEDLLWRYAHLSDRRQFERLTEDFCTADVEKVHAGSLKQRFKGRDGCMRSWAEGVLITSEGKKSKPAFGRGGGSGKPLPPRGWAASHLNFPWIIRIADDNKTAWATYYHFLNSAKVVNNELVNDGHSGTDTFWLSKQDRWRIKKWVVQTDIGFRPDTFDEPLKPQG